MAVASLFLATVLQHTQLLGLHHMLLSKRQGVASMRRLLHDNKDDVRRPRPVWKGLQDASYWPEVLLDVMPKLV